MKIVNAKTGKFAILGDPIEHSLSPVIMNSMFARLGMDNVFLALRANRDTIGTVFPALRATGFRGIVLTMPVKEDAARMVDRLEAEAELTGVTNCVVNEGGVLTGHNTDSAGFWTSVMEKTAAAPESVFIMGAGGFAKAAAAQAALRGVKRLWAANRFADGEFMDSFRRFAGVLRDRFPGLDIALLDWKPEEWRDALGGAAVVANATPNGLNGGGDLERIFPFDAVRADAVFFDAIYSPPETAFLAAARARGHACVGGLDLLAHQGARSFTLWTGADASPAVMRDDALRFLETM